MKDILNQQVIAHIKRLNPWWETGAPDKYSAGLRPRAYLQQVLGMLRDESLRRAVVLLGPRRVGKTILIQHLVGELLGSGVQGRRCAYLEMDHPMLHGLSLESLIGLIEAATPEVQGLRFLFFDEIQSHKDWEKHLKPLVDHRPELRILVSGSAAAALKRKSTESGAGRFTDFLLPPLTFSEYLDLTGQGALALGQLDERRWTREWEPLNAPFVDYVNYGGYPELALSPSVRSDPARFVKSDIVDKVLLRDLPQLYGIQDIQELNALFTLLALNTAEEVSLEQLSQRSGVAKPTIQRYIEYLEAAFLIKRVFRVDQDGKRYQRARAFKVYLTNPAMFAGLFGPRGADDAEFGHLVETAIFAQCFHHEQVSLHYARWGSGDYEVDLVESFHGQAPMSALEIKWSDRYVERPEELKGLVRFGRNNRLEQVLATTRTRWADNRLEGLTVHQRPAAVLAWLYGRSAVRSRLAMHDAIVNEERGAAAETAVT